MKLISILVVVGVVNCAKYLSDDYLNQLKNNKEKTWQASFYGLKFIFLQSNAF